MSIEWEQHPTTNIQSFGTTSTGSPRWTWEWTADGQYVVKEVRAPTRGAQTGDR